MTTNTNLPKGKNIVPWVIGMAVTAVMLFGTAWVVSKGWKKGQN